MGLHVLDQGSTTWSDRERHVPVGDKRVRQIGQNGHIDRVADVELILLVLVVRKPQVDRLHGRSEAGRTIVRHLDGLQTFKRAVRAAPQA